MRIVHLTQSTVDEVTGGLEYHIAYLTAALRRRGHEVIVVSTTALTNSTLPGAEAIPAGHGRRKSILPAFVRHPLDVLAETFLMFSRRMFKRRYAAQIAAHVDQLRPDLVHQHSYLGELRACWLISCKYPLVFTNHTGAYLHLDRWAPSRFLQRQLMKQFTKVISPSRELLPRTGNSHYVPNGVDTETFFPLPAPARAALKARLGVAGKRVFLCPRRWAPTKGIIYLARALRRLSPATARGSVFIFAGNDTPGYRRYQQSVRQELAAAACEVRIQGNLGHGELSELMNISEACIIPSLMEATSLACLEAMACGTPVVGTRTGGLLELIRDGENGWLAPMRDEQALAARIEEIVSADPADLDRIRQRAFAMTHEDYTWDAAARATEKIYQEARRDWSPGEAGFRSPAVL